MRGGVVLPVVGIEHSKRHVRRRHVRRQRQRAQRRLARRIDELRVALLNELQEVRASEVRVRGRESRVRGDDLLEQWNRGFERMRPVVVREQVVRAPVVLLLAGDRCRVRRAAATSVF